MTAKLLGEVFNRARGWGREPMTLTEVLTSRQWVKNDFGSDQDKTACLIGALAIVACGSVRMFLANGGWNEDTRARRMRLNQIVQRHFPERAMWSQAWGLQNYAVSFNNHPDTTLEDVLKIAREYDREVEAGVAVE